MPGEYACQHNVPYNLPCLRCDSISKKLLIHTVESKEMSEAGGSRLADEVQGSHVRGDAQERKSQPVCTGVLDYFPDAMLEVARVSKLGNDQHNPGQPLHWAKEKSRDEADALLRHLIDRGKLDTDGMRHSAKVAWRALAMLQREIEVEQGYGINERNGKWEKLNQSTLADDYPAGGPIIQPR